MWELAYSKNHFDLPKKLYLVLCAKDGNLDHFWPVRLHLLYLYIYQGFKSGFQWSIYFGEGWSGAMAFTNGWDNRHL